jgi:hypothetical protein
MKLLSAPLLMTSPVPPPTCCIQNVANFCICYTSEKSPVSLIIATLPKTPFRKSFACHTYDPLPPSAHLASFVAPFVLIGGRRSKNVSAIVKGRSPVYVTVQLHRTARLYAWHAEPGSPAGVPYAGERAAQRGKPLQERPFS